ncbi:glycosyltransferase family 4 protein [Acidimangrovimonas pyrenivorans]|uniref:Glycosyltransferase family 4 protein n=1 Tax=Acidimangrovimonas pyrenivorans TaxID=2030798 RepID=A0ABV7ACE5_9RHOB
MSRHVVIVNDSSTARGGATGLALLSARMLRARGIDVTLFTGDDGGNPELAEIGVEVVPVGGARLLQQPKWQAATAGLYNTQARDALAALIAERDTPATVYHVHVWSQILSPSIFTALQKVAPRVLAHAHDLFLACPNSVFTDYKRGVPCRRRPLGLDCLTTNCDKRSYVHKLWRVARHAGLLRAFDQRLDWGGIAIIHPGMVPLMELGGYAAERLHVVRNPVTPYTDHRIEAERNDRLLFVGRVEADKGVRELVAAAAQAEMPLTVAGEGALRAELEAAHPEVAFAGWQDRAGIARLAARARAVVVPSRHAEPFGLVVAEASQSGLPVLVANSALLAPEIVDNGLGLGFDMARPGDLAAALQRFRALSDDAVARISRRGFDRVVALANTPESWIGDLLGLYDGMSGRGLS